MSSLPIDTTNNLVIEINSSLAIETFQLEVLSYLGQFTTDVYYFQVNILSIDDSSTSSKLGLLRVGAIDGGLSRELQLRQILGDYKMIAELLAHTTAESVIINLHSTSHQLEDEQPQQRENEQDNSELEIGRAHV